MNTVNKPKASTVYSILSIIMVNSLLDKKIIESQEEFNHEFTYAQGVYTLKFLNENLPYTLTYNGEHVELFLWDCNLGNIEFPICNIEGDLHIHCDMSPLVNIFKLGTYVDFPKDPSAREYIIRRAFERFSQDILGLELKSEDLTVLSSEHYIRISSPIGVVSVIPHIVEEVIVVKADQGSQVFRYPTLCHYPLDQWIGIIASALNESRSKALNQSIYGK